MLFYGREKMHLYLMVGVSLGRGSCLRSGNMYISMLWSVLVSSRGTDGRANDDRGKDVVPHIQGK